jgi:hypothetical protein
MGGDVKDERSVDEKLAPHDFVADFVWAAREVFRKPGVALTSIAFWGIPSICFSIARYNNPLAGFIGVVSCFWAIGWLGAERTFFRDRRAGKYVALRGLLASVPFYIGRFLRLALLAGLVSIPVRAVTTVILVRWLGQMGKLETAETLNHAELVAMMVVADLALTFVTPALVFTTRSAREALRIGFRMIRRTWPRSGLYVLCPPLALNLLNSMYRTHHHPVVTVVTTAALTVLALVAKGATAAFYLREQPVASAPSPAVADVE